MIGSDAVASPGVKDDRVARLNIRRCDRISHFAAVQPAEIDQLLDACRTGARS
jgi:hypothetical protein